MSAHACVSFTHNHELLFIFGQSVLRSKAIYKGASVHACRLFQHSLKRVMSVRVGLMHMVMAIDSMTRNQT